MNELTLPFRIVSVANARDHWAAKAARTKSHREGVYWALLGAKLPPPRLPCTVTLTRIAPRALDDDNNTSGMKALRDGIADWMGLDDRDTRVTWKCAQAKGKPREYGVRIAFESAA